MATASDSFTGSNVFSLSNYSSNWTDNVGQLRLVSNAVTGNTAGFDVASWNATSFGDAQFSQAVATAKDASCAAAKGVAVQVSGTKFYYALWDRTDNHLYVGSYNAGTIDEDDAGIDSYSVNDVLRIECDGSGNITVKRNGVTKYTGAKTAFTGGKPGLCCYGAGSVGELDDWQGGDIDAGGSTGDLNIQLATAVVSSSATITVTASSNRTLANVQTAAIGNSTVVGATANQLTGIQISAPGSSTVIASLSQTLDIQVSASGNSTVTGILAKQLAGATLQAYDSENVTGTVNFLFSNASTVSAGVPTVLGSSGKQLDPAQIVGQGSVKTIGSLIVSLGNASIAALTVPTVTGVLSNQIGAAMAASGSSHIVGLLASSLANAALSSIYAPPFSYDATSVRVTAHPLTIRQGVQQS